MIPTLVSRTGTDIQALPAGLHFIALREFREAFAYNHRRAWLFEGFIAACKALREAGCGRIYIGGSYVTSKSEPGDYDACWDPIGVSANLDPVLYDDNFLLERQRLYRGDLLIGGAYDGPTGENYHFLARDKETGQERGMIGIKLSLLEILNV